MVFQKFNPDLNLKYQNRLILVDKEVKLCKKWEKFLVWQMFFCYFYAYQNLDMDKSYQLTVNNTQIYNRKASQVAELDAVEVTSSQFHILKNNQAFAAEIISTDFAAKSYTVKVNGNTYTVAIANALDLLIKEMGFMVGSAKQVNEIKAPMPGLILEMSVKVGQEVQENDCLLILEAMKMENTFLSPRSGIIKSISAKKGDAVDKGQLLIEFE